MPKVLVLVYPWESPRLYESEVELERGDRVIVKTEYSNELGVVEDANVKTRETAEKILRKSTKRDEEVFEENERRKEELVSFCKDEVRKLSLEMKVVGVRESLDGKQIIFVFTSDGRVDFRELVKELSRVLKKSIRMQQIGSRDEARQLGGLGVCGRDLCCVSFKGNITSITTDMARVQQISHRGSERISGVCGRLMCCLAYEAQQYRELLEGMPEVYSVVKTKSGKGTVMEVNAMEQEIKVKLENGEYIVIKKEDIK